MKEIGGENDRGGTGMATEGKSWRQMKTGGEAVRQRGEKQERQRIETGKSGMQAGRVEERQIVVLVVLLLILMKNFSTKFP